MKKRTLYHQIEVWIRHRNGECFCDACIAQEVGAAEDGELRRAVAELSVAGRGMDYSRYRGTCSLCGALRAVVSPNRLVWA